MDSAQVNGWLALWAVIGPVLVAGISTWYNRKNQVADRKFNAEWDLARRQEDRNEKLAEFKRNDAHASLNWRRNTFIDFLSASFDYVHQGSGQQEHDVREQHRQRFSRTFATLVVLDPAIRSEATQVWQTCNDFAGSTDPKLKNDMGANLGKVRLDFALKAQSLLEEQTEEEEDKSEAAFVDASLSKAGPC